ncbi:hypothetical protein [Dyella choica]|uniref:hypothetical protein n=1 Tax=Dyella choica TaxID=1927959 RepID=UPI0018AD41B4|nr:hypothetical protein [Dyella choica]
MLHHILNDKERPYYAHKMAAYMDQTRRSDPLLSFADDASEWITNPCDIDIRFAARKSSNGEYEILAAQVVVGPFPFPPSSDFNFQIEIGNFWFGQLRQHNVAFAVANAILQEAYNGVLAVFGKLLKFRQGQRNYYRSNKGSEWQVLHAGLLIQSPVSHDRPDASEWQQLDNDLRMTSPPFDGLEDLLYYLEMKDDFSDDGSTSRLRINIFAPVGISIDNTKVEEGKIQVAIVAHPTLAPDSIHVGLRASPYRGVSTRLQVADLLKWEPAENGTKLGTAVIEMPGVDAAQIMLSLGNQYVRRYWVTDPIRSQNQRYMATRLFDSKLKRVRHYLLDDSNPDKFELAVASLLYMMGFNPAVQLETDSSDILVMAPSGRFALVECTLRVSDVPAKVGKLVHRREMLIKELSTDNPSVQVLSVLVCQAERAQIAAQEKELAQKGVVLMAKEDLQLEIDTNLHVPVDPEVRYLNLLSRISQLATPPPPATGELFGL